MSIKLKLIFLATIPLLVIAAMGLNNYRANVAVTHEMAGVQRLSDLAVCLSSMVHETQKERGRTAGFLGSKGAKFSRELTEQRKLTDRHIAEVRAFLADFEASRFDPTFQDALSAALSDLGQIQSQRQAISKQNVTLGAALSYYTQMNSRFLDAIGTMAQQSRDADLTRTITAYMHFLKGKERAGIERAVLANTFAADAFGEGMFRKWISLMTQQDIYLTEFKAIASPQALAFWKQTASDAAFDHVQRYRDTALAKSDTGHFGVDAGTWFATITQKINKLKEVEDFLSQSLRTQAADASAQAVRAKYTIGGAVSLIVILFGLGSWLTLRSINRPLDRLVAGIREIQSTNNLTLRVENKSKDEIGQLARCFNEFVETLRDIISQVHGTSEEVAAAATEVAASSDQLSAGMGEQANQVRSISAAIEEMSSSVVEIARQASDATEDANQASHAASDGQRVVQETVEGMNTIRTAVDHSAQTVSQLGKRGEQIGQIIDVINDIADQTNLLALNAAIEAARAGEHGRGFAVVADEVRKLADRTTQATDEVGASINAIQTETSQAVERMNIGTDQVQVGVASATKAGTSLEQIVSTSSELIQKIQSIAAAAQEQSAASQEVALGIESINEVTSQSLQGTRQSTEASEHLSRKAEQLRELVARFDT